LLEIGAIERRRVKLRDPSDYLRLLTTSITKLKSIEEIVRLESSGQGEELRCVILTDSIRKGQMPKNKGGVAVCEDIGIVPIFEYLRCPVGHSPWCSERLTGDRSQQRGASVEAGCSNIGN
jgi:hypothetical protein